MRRLWYAIGNELRGDDGVARRVTAECRGGGWEIHTVHQLTPEVALEMAGADEVLFQDADALAESVTLERIDLNEVPLPAGLDGSHRLTPRTLVALAMRLYGFAGRAYLFRLPAVEFGVGSSLSPMAEGSARQVCELLGACADWPQETRSGV